MLLMVSWPPSASAPLHRVAAPPAGDAGREAQRRVRRGAVADRDRDPAVGEVGRLVDEQLAHPDVDRQSSVVSCIKRWLSAVVAERLASTTNLFENLLG